MMLGHEGLNLGKNAVVLHGEQLSRVITRTSSGFAGDYTKLRGCTYGAIAAPMTDAPAIEIDLDRLKADMLEFVERKSGRKLSLAVTGGKNPDWYRNFVNNGQDKRISADVYLGIVRALGKEPYDYVPGLEPSRSLPSATVLATTFAVLLSSVGIDPYEDERAQKLARQFPNALRSIEDLQAQDDVILPSLREGESVGDEDRV